MIQGLHRARPLLDEQGVVLESVLQPEISASWQRCLEQGLDPRGDSPDCVLTYEKFHLHKQRAERPLMLARPEMELLASQIAGHDYLIAFGDTDGVVLDVLTDSQADGTPMARSIIPGSVWNEELRGTNALGLVAKRAKRLTVSGPEHFFAANATISCIAAPVFRSDGSLAGVLDVTSPMSDRERHTATLVGLAALNISNRLFVEDHRNELILYCHPREEYLTTQSAGLLAFDRDGRMTGATAMARDILPDIAGLRSRHFSDVFQDGYARTLDSIQSGDTAQLRDRRGSSVFVRIRLTRGPVMGLRAPGPQLTLGLPALQIDRSDTPVPAEAQITGDDYMNKQIALCAEVAEAGLPVRICGRSGSGLSQTARAVHAHLRGKDRCIEIDCVIAKESHLDFSLRGQVVGGAGPAFGPLLETRGNVTLILDGIEALGDRALPVTKRLLGQLDQVSRDNRAPGSWTLLVIERCSQVDACLQDSSAEAFDDFWGHSFCVPPLSARMDLGAVSQTILSEFAPAARLDEDALPVMRQLGDHLTFYSLRRLLFQLSRREATGLIGADRVRELLPWLAGQDPVCEACLGHSTREANCRRIRKTMRECDGNVSLAARRLGVSRNTVYKHAGPAK
ncbi:sigma-54-dependent Fis family transcriptional regulator [Fluviibacterium sp. S390]|uniref:sigma-54-dependent Fis family transcriptional regulator n=1 Tax=Fluviibacterium sp. S390 TaxID=3415139 RepID=UPI003C7AB897